MTGPIAIPLCRNGLSVSASSRTPLFCSAAGTRFPERERAHRFPPAHPRPDESS